MKINKKINIKLSFFSAVKNHWILHGRVFVMDWPVRLRDIPVYRCGLPSAKVTK